MARTPKISTNAHFQVMRVVAARKWLEGMVVAARQGFEHGGS